MWYVCMYSYVHDWTFNPALQQIFLSHYYVLPTVVKLEHSDENVSYQYSSGLVEMTDQWKGQIDRRALWKATWLMSDKNQRPKG